MSQPEQPVPQPDFSPHDDPRLEGTFSVLDKGGVPLPDAQLPDHPTLLRLYRAMRRARIFDDRALVWQRQGKLGVYPLFGGMEATQVGATLAIEPNRDWLAPTYRGSGAMLAYGHPIERILANWRTHPDANRFEAHQRILPVYTPIANQLPHITGIALAEKIQAGRGAREMNVALAFVGDGGTSEGDFHVGVNFAGVYGVPAIFIIENNGWAISTPTSTQTAAKTLASRGAGYGIPAVRVDGNDLLAVYQVASEAVARARRGEGPTLIEAITYRVMPHTSSDDPARYRDSAHSDAWNLQRNPGKRLRAYLESLGIWDEAQEEALIQEVEAELQAAMVRADAAPSLQAWELLDHVFETPTPDLLEQQAELRALEALA